MTTAPIAKLGAMMIPTPCSLASAAASSSAASCMPVDPTTTLTLCGAASRMTPEAPSAFEKSTTTSAPSNTSDSDDDSGAEAAPSGVETVACLAARSTPATGRMSSSPETADSTCWPILPSAPLTTTLMEAIAYLAPSPDLRPEPPGPPLSSGPASSAGPLAGAGPVPAVSPGSSVASEPGAGRSIVGPLARASFAAVQQGAPRQRYAAGRVDADDLNGDFVAFPDHVFDRGNVLVRQLADVGPCRLRPAVSGRMRRSSLPSRPCRCRCRLPWPPW